MVKENIKRFNMAFTKENYEYVSFLASVSHISMTDAVNKIVSADRDKNAETVNAIKEILKTGEVGK